MPTYTRNGRRSRSPGLTLGLVREHFGAGLDGEVEAAVREAVKVYESLGAKVKEVSLPHGKYGVAVYYIIAPVRSVEQSGPLRRRALRPSHRRKADARRAGRRAEASSSRPATSSRPSKLDTPLVRLYRQSRAEGFGPEVKRRIMLGTYALERRLLRRLLPQGPARSAG